MRINYYYKDVDGFPAYFIGETELYIGDDTKVTFLSVNGNTEKYFTNFEAKLEIEGDFYAKLEKSSHTGREHFNYKPETQGKMKENLTKVKLVFKDKAPYLFFEEKYLDYKNKRAQHFKILEETAINLAKTKYSKEYEVFYEKYKNSPWWYGNIRNYATDYPTPGLATDVAKKYNLPLAKWGYMNKEKALEYLGEKISKKVAPGGLTAIALAIENVILEIPELKALEDFIIPL